MPQLPLPAENPPPAPGMVYLVGAGSGDPGLLTLRGAECLRRAHLVLYDYLVNPRLLDGLPSTTQTVCLGRHGQGRLMTQEEVHERLIAASRAGQIAVRLKGGDPAVFARTAEETAALRAAGVPYEIVPGVTAALAVAAYAGVPLTHREQASAVAFVTGHEDQEKNAPPLDYRQLARFPGTLVFYMGVTTAGQWTAELLAGGLAPETPCAIVRRCSWPDQQTIACTLAGVADELSARALRPPVLVIVGEAARDLERATWFTRRPLFGRRVLVTRPADQAADLAAQLEELGAAVLVQPAIEIGPPEDWAPADAALQQVQQYDWLVFSSANGVRFTLDRLCHPPRDLRALADVRLAAIGPATAAELARYHLRADLLPGEYRAEALAEALAAQAAGRRFLLLRASRGREVLAEQICAAGGVVDQVVVYHSSDVQQADPEAARRLAAGEIDWVTVTSSAIARSLVALFGDALRQARLASISPITSATLRELGHEPAVEAAEYTTAGLTAAILHAASVAAPPL